MLNHLQQQFAQAIFGGDKDSIAHQVKSDGTLSAEQRVGIYRNSVHGSLRQYLASLFKVTYQLLGEDFFNYVSDEYINAHPPSTPHLSEYGEQFAHFLLDQDSLQSMPWLSDVARIEWYRHQAWNAINLPVSDFSKLGALTEQQQMQVYFSLPLSATLVHADYAVDQVWLAHQNDVAEEQAISLEAIDINQPAFMLIWRLNRTLQQFSLSQLQWQFLTSVEQKKNMDELSEIYQEELPGLISNAVQRGWVVNFHSSD